MRLCATPQCGDYLPRGTWVYCRRCSVTRERERCRRYYHANRERVLARKKDKDLDKDLDKRIEA